MDVIERKLTIVDYALQIGKSCRQAKRIIIRIKKEDAQGVLYGNTGRIPHNKTPLETELLIIDLLRSKYQNFNLTHLNEQAALYDQHEIKKGCSTRNC